jgi:dihydrofolate synthase/folylpolyglutamate synthase
VPLTYFEIATALGFLLMAEEGVQIAVLETGLGGRLDAVTTCAPTATAVTSIAVDHTEYLGESIGAIAREKAGIIKPGVPHVLGPLPAEADEEMARAAAAAGAPLLRFGRDFPQPPAAAVSLAGAHQRANAAVALELARQAATRLGRALPPEAVAAGLGGVRWPGRLEWIGHDLLLDCAHNAEGAAALAAALPALAAGRRVALVVSLVRDKDAAAMLAALAPLAAAVVATRSSNPRAVDAAALEALARPRAAVTRAVEDPEAALAEARRLAGPGGLVVVAGSIFLVGELRARLLGEPVDPRAVSDPL